MKTFKLIGMVMIAIMMCMSFASCGNEDVVALEEPQNDDYITVGLGCTGEFLEFSDSPMSRTAEDALYGIQVFALTKSGTNEDETITYYNSTPYAYGMFTSLENIKIKLLRGKQYRFDVGIAIDPFKYGQEHWFHETYNQNQNKDFTYSSQQEVYPTAHSGYASHYTEYLHDRYYGELEIYTPTENENINIYTKRVGYGVKYETTGLKTGETLTIEVSKPYDESSLYTVEIGNEPHDGIYTFSNILSAWYDTYNEYVGPHPETGNPMYNTLSYRSEKKLAISWNKADGNVIPMGTYDVTFKRNVKTTIRINAENLNIENGIKVFKEEASMVDDKYIYEITGGSVVEIPVTPGN